jgi:hypothetical protein
MTRLTTLLLAVMLTGAGGGCRRDDSSRESAMIDSTLFGDDRARQGDSARTVPDVALLEHLVDEYEQLDVVMDELAGPTSGGPVQGKAWKRGRHEDAEKEKLLDLLQVEFAERYLPRTPEGAARRSDGIAALPPDAGTRALNGLVLDHHQRAYQAIGEALPRLRNPRVRDQLTRLRQRLGEEIEQLKAAPPP